MTRTNAYTLLCMVIRAIAIWALLKFAIGVPSLALAFRSQEDPGLPLGWVLTGCAVLMVLVALLWLFADKLAKLALVRPQEQVFESTLEPAAWLGLAISAIGAWNVFDGIVNLLYGFPRWLLMARLPGELTLENGLDQGLGDGLSALVQIGLGLFCLLRGPGLSRLVNRLRYGQAVGG